MAARIERNLRFAAELLTPYTLTQRSIHTRSGSDLFPTFSIKYATSPIYRYSSYEYIGRTLSYRVANRLGVLDNDALQWAPYQLNLSIGSITRGAYLEHYAKIEDDGSRNSEIEQARNSLLEELTEVVQKLTKAFGPRLRLYTSVQ